MKIAFVPKGNYSIGQEIIVAGRTLRVESHSHTGKNLCACTLDGSPRFERIMCICTDAPPIVELLK